MDHSQYIRDTVNESDEFIPGYLPPIDADDIDECLIDTVKGYPHLYNKADPDHKNRDIIRNTWQEIGSALLVSREFCALYLLFTLMSPIINCSITCACSLSSGKKMENFTPKIYCGKKAARTTDWQWVRWRKKKRMATIRKNVVLNRPCVPSEVSFLIIVSEIVITK